MKIVVIGGSGLIGSRLVSKLRQDKHDVVAASPATGVDSITGEGLADAMRGAQPSIRTSRNRSVKRTSRS